MNKGFNVQFGKGMFNITDAWPSRASAEVYTCPAGSQEDGSSYLSLPLTDAQKQFLGGTDATHIRVAVKPIK